MARDEEPAGRHDEVPSLGGPVVAGNLNAVGALDGGPRDAVVDEGRFQHFGESIQMAAARDGATGTSVNGSARGLPCRLSVAHRERAADCRPVQLFQGGGH